MKFKWLFRILDDTMNLTAVEKFLVNIIFDTYTVQCYIQEKYYLFWREKEVADT